MRASGLTLLALVAGSVFLLYAAGVMTTAPTSPQVLSPAGDAPGRTEMGESPRLRRPLVRMGNTSAMKETNTRSASEEAARSSLATVVASLSSPGAVPIHDVILILRHGARVVERAQFGSSESVRFVDLVPGRYSLEILAESLAPGYLAAPCSTSGTTRWPFQLRQGARHELALSFHRSASLHGVVLDAEGLAVSGASVRLQSTQYEFELPDASTRSDDFGNFAFADLPPGTYRAHVRWPEGTFTGAAPAPRVLTLHEGGQAALTSLGEARPRSVHGRLVDEGGHGVADVLVQCEMMPAPSLEPERQPDPAAVAPWSRILARARTDAEGRFCLDGLPRVSVLLRAAPRSGSARGLRRVRPRHQEALAGNFDLRLGQAPVDAGRIAIRLKH